MSGRKRKLDSKSPTPAEKEIAAPSPNKKSKKKKAKTNKKPSSSGDASENKEKRPRSGSIVGLESTATQEGKIMTQVMSTFSRMEQSRFEAFRRATFAGDAIASYVAHCLQTRLDKDYVMGSQSARPLSDLVVPGQAAEITAVVSTLAKAYAQRLVYASCALQNQQASGGSDSQDSQPCLQKDSVQKVHYQRQAQGVDPGFFLHSDINGRSDPLRSIATQQQECYSQQRLAALQAQEEYDKVYPAPMEVDEDKDAAEKNLEEKKEKAAS